VGYVLMAKVGSEQLTRLEALVMELVYTTLLQYGKPLNVNSIVALCPRIGDKYTVRELARKMARWASWDWTPIAKYDQKGQGTTWRYGIPDWMLSHRHGYEELSVPTDDLTLEAPAKSDCHAEPLTGSCPICGEYGSSMSDSARWHHDW